MVYKYSDLMDFVLHRVNSIDMQQTLTKGLESDVRCIIVLHMAYFYVYGYAENTKHISTSEMMDNRSGMQF